jgi:hypothetical protein
MNIVVFAGEHSQLFTGTDGSLRPLAQALRPRKGAYPWERQYSSASHYRSKTPKIFDVFSIHQEKILLPTIRALLKRTIRHIWWDGSNGGNRFVRIGDFTASVMDGLGRSWVRHLPTSSWNDTGQKDTRPPLQTPMFVCPEAQQLQLD